MHVLLPPSEGKRAGGSGPPLRLDALPFPDLTAVRERIVDALALVSADPEAARPVLRVPPTVLDEVAANTAVRTAPTLAALDRYDGVLYRALSAPALSPAERARADGRLLIASALFGVVAADSEVPAYRLSAGATLPGVGGIAAAWRPWVAGALAALPGLLVDLRSAAYAGFGSPPGTVTVRMVRQGPGGLVTAIGHDNKAAKGALARLLATTRARVEDAADLVRLLRRAGWTANHTGDVIEVHA
ncbi:YaaA family protein [Nakamurella endophytica]|uniref:YaaA family protein n=1 Tax=Nakamurella endophytica TaxID=1748367 RepID=UPI0016636F05|nr:peroxide stress protein YaaA [Nakamurella endophytica]